MVTALGIGLVGAVLVAVARGVGLERQLVEGPAVTFGQLVAVWLQLAAAAALCHALLAWRRPSCDQFVLPLSVALTGLGLATIFSLSPAQAGKQVTWLWVSFAVFAATILIGRDLSGLRQYKYLLGCLTAGLLLVPMLVGTEVNGARLWIRIGGATIQPGELAKITLVLFLAGYLAEKGELIVEEPRRIGPLTLPDPQFLLPLLLMWAVGMAMLVLLRDLGTALLFYGTVVAMLYLATDRVGFLAVGALSFAGGAALCARLFGHVQARLSVWLDPWPKIDGTGYQVIQGLFALAAGGVGGVGLGMGSASRIPAATTDFPFAAICEELGLWGAGLILALFLIWVHRALRVGVRHPDAFRGLVAAGLGCLMATQALVICGGVTRIIPLTGITLPFISYGGSSLLTNYLALGLLLRCSEGQR